MFKFKTIVLLLVSGFISMTLYSVLSAETVNGPGAFTNNDNFQFQPVPEGKLIDHDYIIQNKGNAVLNIEKVKTG